MVGGSSWLAVGGGWWRLAVGGWWRLVAVGGCWSPGDCPENKKNWGFFGTALLRMGQLSFCSQVPPLSLGIPLKPAPALGGGGGQRYVNMRVTGVGVWGWVWGRGIRKEGRQRAVHTRVPGAITVRCLGAGRGHGRRRDHTELRQVIGHTPHPAIRYGHLRHSIGPPLLRGRVVVEAGGAQRAKAVPQGLDLVLIEGTGVQFHLRRCTIARGAGRRPGVVCRGSELQVMPVCNVLPDHALQTTPALFNAQVCDCLSSPFFCWCPGLTQ